MKAFDTLTQQIQDFQVFRVGDDVVSYVGIVVNHEIRTPWEGHVWGEALNYNQNSSEN